MRCKILMLVAMMLLSYKIDKITADQISGIVQSEEKHDLLILKSGDTLKVVVKRILPSEIEYVKVSNLAGPLYITEKERVKAIIFENGVLEQFADVGSKGFSKEQIKRYSVSVEGMFGAFGLFNVDNTFTKSKYTFGGTPSFMIRISRQWAIGTECMLLWGQADTKDPLRFIINPNIRAELYFPLRQKLLLELVMAAGMSIWPVHNEAGVLDETYFDQRGGWDARVSFGGEYMLFPGVAFVGTVGYSANSSESRDVWITHDMMMVAVGTRFLFGFFEK